MAANLNPSLVAGGRLSGVAEAEDTLFKWSDSSGRFWMITLVSLVAWLTIGYWRVLADTSQVWSQPQYSHGWIVPLIGLYVFWCRRPDPSERAELTPLLGVSAGLGLILVAAGYFTGTPWLQGAGLAACVVGVMTTGLMHQPFSEIGSDWRLEFSTISNQVLLIVPGLATLTIVATFLRVLPERLILPAMLMAVLAYGVALLGVALAARTGPIPRTGSETWASLLTIVGSSIVWVQASQYDMMPLMRLCFVAALLGVFGLVGGRRLLKWAGPGILFLVFMFPLPSIVEHTALLSLQKVATAVSTLVLQIMGLPIYRAGLQIVIEGLSDKQTLEVAEACSGLRMSTIFGAMTVAMACLIRRPWWDKFTLLLSAIPVALAVNIIRIVVTAMIYYAYPDNKDLHDSVHDLAGYAMMPVALGILWLGLTVLSNLTVADEVEYQMPGKGALPGA